MSYEYLNEYSKLSHIPIIKTIIESNEGEKICIKLGNRTAIASTEEEAIDIFIKKYNINECIKELNRLKTADDYIKYGQLNILPYSKLFINNADFFSKTHHIITVDSEGHNNRNYPEIIQFGVHDIENETEDSEYSGYSAYIFNVKIFLVDILKVLQDNSIKKVVFDLNSEQRAFGIKFANTLDIQPPNLSFVKYIYDKLNINLKKNKRIHMRGWDAYNLTKDQVDYSALDVILMCYLLKKL